MIEGSANDFEPDRQEQNDQELFDAKRDLGYRQEYNGERTPVGLEVNRSIGVPQAYLGNALQGPKFFLDELQSGMSAEEVKDLAEDLRDKSNPSADIVAVPTLEEYVFDFLIKKSGVPLKEIGADPMQKIGRQAKSIMRLVSDSKVDELNGMIFELRAKLNAFRDGVSVEGDDVLEAKQLLQQIMQRAEKQLTDEEKAEISEKLAREETESNTGQNPAA